MSLADELKAALDRGGRLLRYSDPYGVLKVAVAQADYRESLYRVAGRCGVCSAQLQAHLTTSGGRVVDRLRCGCGAVLAQLDGLDQATILDPEGD